MKDWNSKNAKKIRSSSIRIRLTTISQGNTLWQFMHILCVSSAKNHISEEERTVHKSWTLIKISKSRALMKNNWSVPNVATFQLKTVPSTESILFNSSANSVVRQPNGSVGVTPISVSPVIKDSVQVTMYPNTKEISYPNAKDLENVQSEEIMGSMETKKCLDAPYAETTKTTRKTSDSSVKSLRLNSSLFDMHIFGIWIYFMNEWLFWCA